MRATEIGGLLVERKGNGCLVLRADVERVTAPGVTPTDWTYDHKTETVTYPGGAIAIRKSCVHAPLQRADDVLRVKPE